MVMCETEIHQTISELRKKTVVSSDGLKIGRIIDIVFDADFNVHSYIIGGSRWEELREALGFIDDIDPVVPVGNIAEITDKEIKLDIQKEKLSHKLEEGALPENAHTYSTLKRMKIIDSVGKVFGKIVNLVYVPCGDIAFIIGGNWFEEAGEKLGLKENVDLLLPFEYVDKISEEGIRLNLKMDDLKIAIDDKPLNPDEQRAYLNSIHRKEEIQMKIMERRKAEEFRDFSRFM